MYLKNKTFIKTKVKIKCGIAAFHQLKKGTNNKIKT